jgi:hypothetical protein
MRYECPAILPSQLERAARIASAAGEAKIGFSDEQKWEIGRRAIMEDYASDCAFRDLSLQELNKEIAPVLHRLRVFGTLLRHHPSLPHKNGRTSFPATWIDIAASAPLTFRQVRFSNENWFTLPGKMATPAQSRRTRATLDKMPHDAQDETAAYTRRVAHEKRERRAMLKALFEEAT